MSTPIKVLFITGASSGFGRALAEAAVQAGHTVVGTVRRDEDAQALESLGSGAHAAVLDIVDDGAVAAAVADTEERFGRIDVVVANAGYGHEGTMEESSMADLRRQFDVNVFGAVATIKAVILDYEATFAPLRAARQQASGNQLGDPARAAQVFLELIAMEAPPTHLLLGSDAIRLVREDRARVDHELAAWEDLSASTDFPDGAQIASS